MVGLEETVAASVKQGRADSRGRSYSCRDGKKGGDNSRLVAQLPLADAVVGAAKLQLQQWLPARHRTGTAAAKAEEKNREEEEEDRKKMMRGGAEVEPKMVMMKNGDADDQEGRRREIKAQGEGSRTEEKSKVCFCF